MKIKKQLKALKQNESIAHEIMEQYPPQMDMEKIFRKTYRRYLAEEPLHTESPAEEEDAVFMECVDVTDIRPRFGFLRAGGYAMAVAACAAIVILSIRTDGLLKRRLPDETRDTDAQNLQTVPTNSSNATEGTEKSSESASLSTEVHQGTEIDTVYIVGQGSGTAPANAVISTTATETTTETATATETATEFTTEFKNGTLTYQQLTKEEEPVKGCIIPAGSWKVTLHIHENSGFYGEDFIMELDSAYEVYTDSNGDPVLTLAKNFEDSLYAAAYNPQANKIGVSIASAKLCKAEGDVFTVYAKKK